MKNDTHTRAQMNLYWHYLRVVASDSGHTPEELHLIFGKMFIVDFSDLDFGVQSTKNLTRKEFSAYIEKIRYHVAEFGIQLEDNI